jgi:hypothetical protein
MVRSRPDLLFIFDLWQQPMLTFPELTRGEPSMASSPTGTQSVVPAAIAGANLIAAKSFAAASTE